MNNCLFRNKIIFAYAVLLCSYKSTAQALPQVFMPGLISNDGVFGFTLSEDGKTALWVDSGGKRDSLFIMESRKIKSKWSSPSLASFSTKTNKWKDIDPIFSPDGKFVYFQSTRPVPGKADKTDFDIWRVEKSKTSWKEPLYLGNILNTDASESYASISNDGTIYFMKDHPAKAGNSEIFFSKLKNNQYEAPENMGAPINTPYRESNPFISPKGDYIIYFSNDATGFGEVDLYISFKEKNGWSIPKNLGPKINSSIAEFCPFVHKKKLYFTRHEKKDGRLNENIYVVDFDANDYR